MSFDAWKQRLDKLEAAVTAAQTPQEEQAALKELLVAFPLLFGYWSRLAKIDESVWPQALESAPCVQLWTEYLATKSPETAEPTAKLAVAKIGRDFNADPVWSAYFDLLPAGSAQRSDALNEVIQIPLYEYAKYAEMARAELPSIIEVVMEDTSRGVGERWQFESRIQRNYFHVFPIDHEELVAWDEYLDYEEDQGNPSQIYALYERCLTATALYEGFWMRYLRWLSVELSLNWDRITKAFTSALLYHPESSRLLTYKAQLLELHGDLPEAGELYRRLGTFGYFEARTQNKPVVKEQDWDPRGELELWRQGKCENPGQLADQLRKFGYLKEFFEVDAAQKIV